MGWTIKEAAEALGVDPGTWGKWERGQTILYRNHRNVVAQFLEIRAAELNSEVMEHWNQSYD